MLGLAVGVDYALFIVSRHRQHLLDGVDGWGSSSRGRRHGPARRREGGGGSLPPPPRPAGPRARRPRPSDPHGCSGGPWAEFGRRRPAVRFHNALRAPGRTALGPTVGDFLDERAWTPVAMALRKNAAVTCAGDQGAVGLNYRRPPPRTGHAARAYRTERPGRTTVAAVSIKGLQCTDYAVIRETRHRRPDGDPAPAGWDGLVPVGPRVALGRISADDPGELVEACAATGPNFDPTPQSPILLHLRASQRTARPVDLALGRR
jgi:hypothetical protein